MSSPSVSSSATAPVSTGSLARIMTAADDISDFPNLTYTEWVDTMVAAGKLAWATNQTEVFYPDPSSTDGDKGTEIDAAHSKVGWKLKNWACGKLTSKGEHWKYAQKHTCDFIKNVEGRAVDSMIWKGIRSYCHHEDQGFECDATIAFVLKFSNTYAGFASPYCLLFFDDMFQHCHEKGGTAEMIHTTNHAGHHHTHQGHLNALFHRADSGDTCPADTTKAKCKRVPF
ncbi:hypothetical protein B0H13DRAFT_1863769 [Mycena leptocephala]|nr:hypothetical protein B0H13DRAFT_1863769 [Mycena leptocephala]